MTLSLNAIDFAALSPLLLLLGGALMLLIVESIGGQLSRKFALAITIATFLVGIYATVVAPSSDNHLLTPWLRFDALAKIFNIIFLTIGLSSALLSSSFFQRFEASHGEYFFLLVSCVVGLMLIGSAADFLTIFLGLETLSISLYILCGYMKKWEISREASIKYFLIGSVAAAFLLYGIALIYGAVGSTQLSALMPGYQALATSSDKALFLCGAALVTLGLAFKAAIVPFHVWAPDVYEGAPTPVTAFMSVGTKIGAFAAFARIFLEALPQFNPVWNQAIALLAYPTLIYANYVALRQTQLRRFFAYSGISHAGFLLIPLAAGTPEALPALLFYVVVYACATLGCFAVLAFLDQRQEGVMLQGLYGLFKRAPFLAGGLSLCLLTLGGIPPTAGFFAKFFIFKVAFQAGYYSLVIVGLLTTILSAFYYMRIVAVMFSQAPAEASPPHRTLPAGIVGVVAFAAIVFLSCYPAPLLELLGSLKG